MEQLFPDLFDDLVARGAHRIDMGAQAGWVHFGKWKIRHHSGLTSYYQSRPLLERCVRARVSALPNVHFVRGDAAELLPTADGNGVNGALIRLRGRADASEQRLCTFFRIWTQKEARIKAHGLAMAHRFFQSAEQLPVVELPLGAQYVGAVALWDPQMRATHRPQQER